MPTIPRNGQSGPQRLGRADVHIHTRYSDGQPSVPEVLEHVASIALDVIAITDHDTIEGALEAHDLASRYGLEVIVGEEISSRQGHILGLFLKEAVPPGLSAAETVAAVHAQGGLAVAAHPFMRGTTHLKGIGSVPMGIGYGISHVLLDGVEVGHSFPTMAWANYRASRFNRRHLHLPELGNSDAHIKEVIGKSVTLFPGRTAQDFAHALRAGQTSVASSPYRPGELLLYLRFWTALRRGDAGNT